LSQELLIAGIAAVSAIAASVSAQIIGARVSRGIEMRRLKAETDRNERDAELRKSERFGDDKRAVFVSYLHARRSIADAYYKHYIGPASREEHADAGVYLEDAGDQLETLETEIGLLAPEVLEEINRIDKFTDAWSLRDRREREDWLVRFGVRTRGIEQAMRRSLGIEVREPTPDDQAELDEAPASSSPTLQVAGDHGHRG
jgi:hypothetical protein